ncbi:unnamed protein product [Timema podura]|uniref:JmjN domain-containing protein n=1 Tax=Timema podura TaxID=61482 RepID=A0ABN7NRR2_TIMPD|nr:unnamed protein product [Timema podura]
MKSRMMTRSCLTEKETKQPSPPVNRISSRPTRKTKEAAALYMELLGKKLTNPEAEVDEDSLSIDSFPELPNARQNERRENELKAKALKEKEISNSPKALRSKGDVRNKDKKNVDESGHKMANKTKKPSNKVETIVSVRQNEDSLRKKPLELSPNTNISTLTKSKAELVENKSHVKSKETFSKKIRRKQEVSLLKGAFKEENETKLRIDSTIKHNEDFLDYKEEDKELMAGDNIKMEDIVAMQESVKKSASLKKKDTSEKVKESENVNQNEEVLEDKSNTILLLRRRQMLRRVSRLSNCSNTTTSETARRTLQSQSSSSSPPQRPLCRSKAQDSTSSCSDKFSDSDEEPLGKIALKSLSKTKKSSVSLTSLVIKNKNNSVENELKKNDNIQDNNTLNLRRKDDFNENHHSSVLRSYDKRKKTSLQEKQTKSSISQQRCTRLESEKNEIKRRLKEDQTHQACNADRLSSNQEKSQTLEEKTINKSNKQDISKTENTKKLQPDSLLDEFPLFKISNISLMDVGKTSTSPGSHSAPILKVPIISLTQHVVRDVLKMTTTMKSKLVAQSKKTCLQKMDQVSCKSASPSPSSSSVPNNSNVGTKDSKNLLEELECDLRQELNISDIVETISGKSEPMVKAQVDDSYVKRMKGQINPPLSEEQAILHGGLATVALKNTIENTSSSYSYSLSKKSHVSKIKKQDVDNKRQSVFVRLSKKSPRKQIGPCKVSGGASNSIDKVNKPGHNTTVPKQVGNFSLVHDVDLDIKKLPRNNTAQRYFSDTKLYQSDLGKCSNKTSHIGIVKNKEMVFKSLGSGDVERKISKCENSKINQSLSSFSNLLIPSTSSAKKPTYKDLKAHRKVNMSTEQIEKWLSESFADDSDEEECLSCSKPKCICSQTALDEELAHLSQYAMEKLSLGNSSECEGLDENKKKLDKSVVGTPFYLKEGDLSRTSEKITTFCLDDFKQKLVQEETNAEPEQPITLKEEINFGEMTTVTSPSTFINKDTNIVKDIIGPGKTPANNYTHNKDSSSSLEKNLKAYVTSQEEFDTDEVFSTSNSNGKQPVTLLQLPLSSSKTNCLQSSTSFCDTVKNTKVKPLQIISLLNQQTTNSTFDETATPTSKDIGNSLVEHAAKTTSLILPPQYTPTSVNWDFVESSPSKKLISSGQVDTESITSTKPTKEKSVTPSTQCNTRPVAHETNQSLFETSNVASSHCTNSATQQPLKSLSDQSVSKTLENISGSTTKHTEQSSIPLVHYSTNSQVQHPSSERLSLLPLVYTSSGAQQPVICTSGDSTVPHLMYTISASEQTSTPQLCYTSSGVMPSSYSTPVCTMVPPLVYTSSFTQQETKCTPDPSTILPLQYTNSSSQQAITFNVGQPISSTAPQIANSNVQQIPTSLAQQVITSSLQHPISSSVETPLNTSITPSVNSSLQQLITSSPQQTKILMVQQPITSVKQISSIHQPILSSIPNQNMSSVQQPVSSSFQHAVNVPFQQVISSSQLTQPVSASLQQTSRTALHQAIALPLQQPLSQLFQQSVNSSFQQSGGFILQQTSAAPLQQTVGSPFQQSISLQLQQQTLGIPCHQTVTVPLQQLTFVPIKSVNLQLQQQIGNIPLQSISSSHPQTITAYGAQSVPLQKPINNLTVQHHTPGIQHSQSIHLPLQQPATNLQVQQASGNILLQQTSATSFSFQQQTITPQQQSNDASIQHQSTNILQSSNSLQQSLPHMQENIIQSTATQQPNSLQHSSSSSQHPTPHQQSSSVQQSNLFTQLETSVAQPSQTLIQQPTSLQEPMSNQQLSLLQQSVASFEEQAPLQQSITSFQPQTSLLQSENSFQQSNAITQQIPFQHSATLVQQPIPLQPLAPAQELTYIQQSTPIKESSSSQELVPIQQSDCLEQPTSTQHSTLIQQSTPIQVSSSLQELVPIQQSTYLEQPTSTQQSTPIQESIPIQHSSSTDLSNSLQQSVSMQQSTPIQHTVCNKDSTSLQQSISFMQQPSSLQQTTCQPSLTLSNQFIPLQESTPCTAVQLSTSPKQPTPLEQPFSPKCSTYIQQSTSPKPSITQSTSPKQSITQSTSPKQSITQSTSPRQSITQTTSPKQPITESTYAKQSSLPQQSTSPKQSTFTQQSTPLKQPTLPRQSTPLKPSTLPQQSTPIKQSTLPQQSTPIKQPTLPQQSTPLKQSTLPQQPTPPKQVTLLRQSTPLKHLTLPQQLTPPKQPTLPQQSTPLKQSTLPQQSTPLKTIHSSSTVNSHKTIHFPSTVNFSETIHSFSTVNFLKTIHRSSTVSSPKTIHSFSTANFLKTMYSSSTVTYHSAISSTTNTNTINRCTRPVEVDVTVPFTNKETVSLSKEADKNRTNKHLKNTLPGNSSHSAGIKSFRHAHKAASHNTVLSNKLLASHKNVKDSTGGGLGSKRQRTPDKSPERKSIFHQRRFAHKLKERKDFTPSASAFSPENESSVYAFEMESELPPINTPFRRRARDSRTSSTNTSKSEEDLSKSLDDESPPPSTYYAQSEKSVPQSVEVDKNVTTSSQQCQVMLVTKAKISPVESSLCRGSASIAVQVNLDNEPLVETQPPSFSLSDAGVVEALPQRSIECSTQTEVTENEEEDDSDGHMFYIPLGGTDTSQSQQLSVAVKLGTEGPTGPNQRVIMSAKLVTKPPCFNRTSTNVQDAKVTGGRRSSLLSQHQRSTGILMMEQKNQFSPSTSSSSTSTSGTYPPVGTVQPTTRARPTITSVASQSKMDATTDTSLVKTTDSEIHHNIEEISSNIQTTVVSKKPCATVIAASKVQPKSGVNVREKRGSNDSQNNVGTVRPSTSKAQQGNVGKLPRGTTDQPPSVSSTSGNNKRGLTKSKMSRSCESVYVGTPVKVPSFPSTGGPAQLVEAPTYHPTEKEFQDPLEYIDKIRPVAEKFGLCRIVPPPNFKQMPLLKKKSLTPLLFLLEFPVTTYSCTLMGRGYLPVKFRYSGFREFFG